MHIVRAWSTVAPTPTGKGVLSHVSGDEEWLPYHDYPYPFETPIGNCEWCHREGMVLRIVDTESFLWRSFHAEDCRYWTETEAEFMAELFR